MKRLSIIIALLTYLVLNLGISLNVHYCGDTVSFVDFFPTKKKSCCDIKTQTCCHDKLAVLQSNTIQNEVGTFKYIVKKSTATIIPTVYFSITEILPSITTSKVEKLPYEELTSSPPLYILNQVFRI